MITIESIWSRYRIQAILAGSLMLSLIISLTLFAVFGRTRDRRFFYFPDNGYRKTGAEMHYLPSRGNVTEELRLYMDELTLGPVHLGLAPVYPDGTRVQSLIFRKGVVYLDFSRQILDFSGKNPMPLGDILSLTERNIRANFIGIKRIVFTIEGREPGSPPIH